MAVRKTQEDDQTLDDDLDIEEEDESVFPEGELEASPDTEEDGEPDSGDDRLRDVLFKELKKRDEKIDQLTNQLSSGFGEIKGMLANQQPAPQGPNVEEEYPELDREQQQAYIDAGRSAELYQYLARREAILSAREENRKLQSQLETQRSRQSATDALYTDFPELDSATHPFTLKTQEIYLQKAKRYGGPSKIEGTELELELISSAAERAARVHGDLRDEDMKRTRRKQNEEDVRQRSNGGLRQGRKRAQKSSDDLPRLSRTDSEVSRDWGIDLQDPKIAKRIRSFKQGYSDQRYERLLEDE
jgi:hypothetical protein